MLDECEAWLKYRARELLFREAVIHFLVGETEEEKKKRQLKEFCKACRAAKRDADCENCNGRVEIRDEA